jgi:hypothetical protein
MQSKYNSSLRLIQLQQQKKIKVVLSLSSGERVIGLLDLTGKEGIFLTHKTRAHLFRKTNSLGINHQLLTSTKIKFKWIVIDYEGDKLVTTRQYFLTKGKVLKFGQQGFELQVFLPLSDFGKDKALAFKSALSTQPTLFQSTQNL